MADAREQYIQEVTNYVNTNHSTEIEKLNAIYSYLAQTTVYNENGSLPTSSPSSLILNNEAVCEAFAYVYNEIGKNTGLNMKYVTGTATQNGVEIGHAWNLVELDGQWYNTDATWGNIDRDGANGLEVNMSYFLFSDEVASISRVRKYGVSEYLPAATDTTYDALYNEYNTGFGGGVTGDLIVSPNDDQIIVFDNSDKKTGYSFDRVTEDYQIVRTALVDSLLYVSYFDNTVSKYKVGYIDIKNVKTGNVEIVELAETGNTVKNFGLNGILMPDGSVISYENAEKIIANQINFDITLGDNDDFPLNAEYEAFETAHDMVIIENLHTLFDGYIFPEGQLTNELTLDQIDEITNAMTNIKNNTVAQQQQALFADYQTLVTVGSKLTTFVDSTDSETENDILLAINQIVDESVKQQALELFNNHKNALIESENGSGEGENPDNGGSDGDNGSGEGENPDNGGSDGDNGSGEGENPDNGGSDGDNGSGEGENPDNGGSDGDNGSGEGENPDNGGSDGDNGSGEGEDPDNGGSDGDNGSGEGENPDNGGSDGDNGSGEGENPDNGGSDGDNGSGEGENPGNGDSEGDTGNSGGGNVDNGFDDQTPVTPPSNNNGSNNNTGNNTDNDSNETVDPTDKPTEDNEQVEETPTTSDNVITNVDINIIAGTTAVEMDVTENGTIIVTSNELNNRTGVTITLPVEKVHGILKIKTDKGYETVPYTVKNGQIVAQLHKVGELVFVDAVVDLDDISSSQYKEYITKLAERGIVSGDSGKYNANAKATRGQFAAMVSRALGLNELEGNKFSDISNNQYSGYINALADFGIVTGREDGTFNANGTITRQQAFTMIGRLLEQKGYSVDTSASSLAGFKDANSVSDYAKPYVDLLISIGAVNGDGGNLNPQQEITRGQIAKILAVVLAELELL